MLITLQTLMEINACTGATVAFIETFGEDGTPTAAAVFHALVRAGRLNWLSWLDTHLIGFNEAISNADEVGFELISKRQPKTIRAIKTALARGETAQTIERDLIRRFGDKQKMTVALVAGASYYLEAEYKYVSTHHSDPPP